MFFLLSKNLHTRKINNINVFSGGIFRLKRNNSCSTFTINIESDFTHSLNEHIYLLAIKYIYILIPALRCIHTEMFFKVRGFCCKVIYLMTNKSLFSISKGNILLTKILANVPLINWHNVDCTRKCACVQKLLLKLMLISIQCIESRPNASIICTCT